MHAPFLIIGNWKSNKTIDEAKAWCEQFSTLYNHHEVKQENVKVVICPSTIHLSTLASLIHHYKLPLALGIQDISPYGKGAYTGAVSADMVKDIVSFSLVGHSERRKHFAEIEEALSKKVVQLKSAHIEPVYCVQDATMSIPDSVSIVGYEPTWAIGTGKADTPENANGIARQIREKHGNHITVVYGGSVTAANVAGYVRSEYLGGVLPGGASLDPKLFFELVLAASEAV